MECKCAFCEKSSYISEEYFVNLDFLAQDRPLGVSGILRVRNDAEFLSESIDSCIEALDELVIVYNDCSDDSPIIIENKRKQYPDKIKVFEYKPYVFGNNLTKEEYVYVKNLPVNSIHLLSNYYNYALCKSRYQYVLKIDADQIYYTEKLNYICDLYRKQSFVSINISDVYHVFFFIVNVFLSNRFGVSLHFVNKKKCFEKYRKSLLKFVSKYKVSTSMSGINLFSYKDSWFVSLGRVFDNKLTILSPYNGVGDHPIFKVSRKTFFVPYDCPEYNLMTTQKYSLIEYLQGVRWKFPLGFLWFHLNSNRHRFYTIQVDNFLNNEDAFIPLDVFVKSEFSSLYSSLSSDLLTKRQKNIFSYLHDGDVLTVPLCQIKKMKRNKLGYFLSQKKYE